MIITKWLSHIKETAININNKKIAYLEEVTNYWYWLLKQTANGTIIIMVIMMLKCSRP